MRVARACGGARLPLGGSSASLTKATNRSQETRGCASPRKDNKIPARSHRRGMRLLGRKAPYAPLLRQVRPSAARLPEIGRAASLFRVDNPLGTGLPNRRPQRVHSLRRAVDRLHRGDILDAKRRHKFRTIRPRDQLPLLTISYIYVAGTPPQQPPQAAQPRA